MSETNLLTSPIGFKTDNADANRLLTEAEAHMQTAEDYFRRALQLEADEKPNRSEIYQALIQLQAAVLCQQQAFLHLVGAPTKTVAATWN